MNKESVLKLQVSHRVSLVSVNEEVLIGNVQIRNENLEYTSSCYLKCYVVVPEKYLFDEGSKAASSQFYATVSLLHSSVR